MIVVEELELFGFVFEDVLSGLDSVVDDSALDDLWGIGGGIML